jgi:2-hydroxychromene-2-carboxylate isomerase
VTRRTITLRRNRRVLLVGLLVAFLMAGFLSGYASSKPDGLEKVAADQGISAKESQHGLADMPFAGYAVSGIDNQRLAGGLAGIFGVGLTFAVGGALFFAVARLRRPSHTSTRWVRGTARRCTAPARRRCTACPRTARSSRSWRSSSRS